MLQLHEIDSSSTPAGHGRPVLSSPDEVARLYQGDWPLSRSIGNLGQLGDWCIAPLIVASSPPQTARRGLPAAAHTSDSHQQDRCHSRSSWRCLCSFMENIRKGRSGRGAWVHRMTHQPRLGGRG
jgi:hypothetical protein